MLAIDSSFHLTGGDESHPFGKSLSSMYLYDTHITRDDPQSPPLHCTLAVVQQDPAISPPLDNSAVSFLAEIQQCEPQADDADADDVGVAAIVGNASITGGDPQVANGSYSQSVVAAGELHGDIENGVVVNVGHTRAQWLIELCLCNFTSQTKKLITQAAHSHASVVAICKLTTSSQSGQLRFHPHLLQVIGLDFPWTTLRPGVNPQPVTTFNDARAFEAQSSSPVAVVVEPAPKVASRKNAKPSSTETETREEQAEESSGKGNGKRRNRKGRKGREDGVKRQA